MSKWVVAAVVVVTVAAAGAAAAGVFGGSGDEISANDATTTLATTTTRAPLTTTTAAPTTTTTAAPTTTTTERLVEPLDIPDGLVIRYVTCEGREGETNLNLTTLVDAATLIGADYEHIHLDDCDSHRGGEAARMLINEDADVYLVGLSTMTFLRGDFAGRAGSNYPDGIEDHSRIFVPVDGDPNLGVDRNLTAYETWVILGESIRWALDPATSDVGYPGWEELGFTQDTRDTRVGFEETLLQQWAGA